MGGVHGYLDEDTCTVGGPPYIGTTPYAHSCDAAPIMVHLEPPASASPKRLYMEDMVTMVADQTVMYNPVHAVDLTGCWKIAGSTSYKTITMSRVTDPVKLPFGQWIAGGTTPGFQVDGFILRAVRNDGTVYQTGTISSDGDSFTYGPSGTGTTLVYQGPGSC